MANCVKKLCGCVDPCGCGDNVMSQNCPVTAFPECSNPEICAETLDAQCAVYMGDTIVNIGIYNGMRVSDALQRLVGVITNPGCNYPDSPCQSVIGFYTKKITDSTASFKWLAATGATNYRVEYRLTTSEEWTLNPTVTGTSDVIGELTPNTNYYARIATLCEDSTCYSITIQFKTKTS